MAGNTSQGMFLSVASNRSTVQVGTENTIYESQEEVIQNYVKFNLINQIVAGLKKYKYDLAYQLSSCRIAIKKRKTIKFFHLSNLAFDIQ